MIATEHGLASQVLRRMGVELRTTRRAVGAALAGFVHSREQHGSPAPILEQILHRLEAIEKRLAS